jgi:hypothetical protein
MPRQSPSSLGESDISLFPFQQARESPLKGFPRLFEYQQIVDTETSENA